MTRDEIASLKAAAEKALPDDCDAASCAAFEEAALPATILRLVEHVERLEVVLYRGHTVCAGLAAWDRAGRVDSTELDLHVIAAGHAAKSIADALTGKP